MYVSSWIVLTSISGSRKTNSKGRGRGRLRWSLRIEEILGQTDITITGLRETLLDNLDLLLLKWLAWCFEIKSWKKIKNEPYFK